MMISSEIKANYLDIYTDIFGLKDFKKVQKHINDVVGKLFGTPFVTGMTLAENSEFIGKYTHNTHVANNLFGVPATSKMTLKDIDMLMARQITLNTIVDKKKLGNTCVWNHISDRPDPR